MRDVFIAPHSFNDPENPQHGEYVNLQLRNDLYFSTLHEVALSSCRSRTLSLVSSERRKSGSRCRGLNNAVPRSVGLGRCCLITRRREGEHWGIVETIRWKWSHARSGRSHTIRTTPKLLPTTASMSFRLIATSSRRRSSLRPSPKPSRIFSSTDLLFIYIIRVFTYSKRIITMSELFKGYEE